MFSQAMLRFVLICLTLFPVVDVLAGQGPNYEFMDFIIIKLDVKLHLSCNASGFVFVFLCRLKESYMDILGAISIYLHDYDTLKTN